MNRRSFLGASTAFVLLFATAAYADEDYVKDIVDWLDKHGYADIGVTRTLLGRVRIVATKDGRQRELVCNPRTGEILRDVWISAGGEMQPPLSPPRGDGDDDDNSGRGGGDDDNSGHGSGGSGDDDHSGHGGGSNKSGHGGDDD